MAVRMYSGRLARTSWTIPAAAPLVSRLHARKVHMVDTNNRTRLAEAADVAGSTENVYAIETFDAEGMWNGMYSILVVLLPHVRDNVSADISVVRGVIFVLQVYSHAGRQRRVEHLVTNRSPREVLRWSQPLSPVCLRTCP